KEDEPFRRSDRSRGGSEAAEAEGFQCRQRNECGTGAEEVAAGVHGEMADRVKIPVDYRVAKRVSIHPSRRLERDLAVGSARNERHHRIRRNDVPHPVGIAALALRVVV
ncbi:MAG: hypothetical protein RL693_636, partial [Verrucomicrobiota bacterium]